MKQVELIVNGQKEQVQASVLTEVMRHFNLEEKPVVVELDGRIIPKEQWGTEQVESGMKLEIVHFVGGG